MQDSTKSDIQHQSMEEELKVLLRLNNSLKGEASGTEERAPFKKFKVKTATAAETQQSSPEGLPPLASLKGPCILRVKRKRDQEALDKICKPDSDNHFLDLEFDHQTG